MSGLRGRLHLGYIVFGALIASKIVEYAVARLVPVGAWPYLAVLAIIGAWLILYYFMHLDDVLRRKRHE